VHEIQKTTFEVTDFLKDTGYLSEDLQNEINDFISRIKARRQQQNATPEKEVAHG
jgi:hypothetical protein